MPILSSLHFFLFSIPAFRRLAGPLPLFIFLLALGGLQACGGEEAPQDSDSAEDTTDVVPPQDLPSSPKGPPPCTISGAMLEGNWYLARQEGLLLAVVADSTTYNLELGPSHRVLEIYDVNSCERVERHVLPVNRSPDFAYLIAGITYNNNSRIVGLRAFDVIYTYDLSGRRLLPPLEPQYKNERLAVDAQSGLIQRLEVWEDFLVGYAQDYGAFVFDLRNINRPEAVLPFAEYRTPSDRYASLFLLPSGNRQQALLPLNGAAPEDFAINPLFDEPQSLSTNVSAGALDNRFIILRMQTAGRRAVAVDMQERKRIELPSRLQTSNTQDILEWLKEQ